MTEIGQGIFDNVEKLAAKKVITLQLQAQMRGNEFAVHFAG